MIECISTTTILSRARSKKDNNKKYENDLRQELFLMRPSSRLFVRMNILEPKGLSHWKLVGKEQ